MRKTTVYRGTGFTKFLYMPEEFEVQNVGEGMEAEACGVFEPTLDAEQVDDGDFCEEGDVSKIEGKKKRVKMRLVTGSKKDGLGSSTDTVVFYCSQISKLPMMTREEEADVARRLRSTGDPKFAEKLVSSNLRFVVKVAFEYKGYGFNLLDLIQEGNVGLMKAATKFDPERGWRFLSYAVWWIRAYIQEYILTNWSLVRIGTTQFQRSLFNTLMSRKKEAQRRLESFETGASEESILARVTGSTVEEVVWMRNRFDQRDVSIEVGGGNLKGGTLTLLDLVAKEDSHPEGLLKDREISVLQENVLMRAMDVLSERERKIITRRYLVEEPETLRQVGHDFGISKERVRQIEEKALSRIRDFIEEGIKSAELSREEILGI